MSGSVNWDKYRKYTMLNDSICQPCVFHAVDKEKSLTSARAVARNRRPPPANRRPHGEPASAPMANQRHPAPLACWAAQWSSPSFRTEHGQPFLPPSLWRGSRSAQRGIPLRCVSGPTAAPGPPPISRASVLNPSATMLYRVARTNCVNGFVIPYLHRVFKDYVAYLQRKIRSRQPH
jgi:hypothetical protein